MALNVDFDGLRLNCMEAHNDLVKALQKVESGEADYEDVAHQVEEAVDWLRSNAMVLCACFDEKSGIESVVEQIKEVHFLDGSVQEIGDD